MPGKPVAKIVTFPSVGNGSVYSQQLLQTTLKIDLKDTVYYVSDVDDVSQYATQPQITLAHPPKNFGVATFIADIVAVNGQTMSGTYAARARGVYLSPNPNGTASGEASPM